MEQILLHSVYKWNRKEVPKRRHIKFLRRGITQKKEYSKVLQDVLKEENVDNKIVIHTRSF
jgi:hypothetical protein